MSAHDPQGYELAAFGFFKELQPDCEDSHLPLFLENFKKELAEMQAYLEANGCSERTAFEAVFCEPTTATEPQGNKIMPSELPQLRNFKELQEQQPQMI